MIEIQYLIFIFALILIVYLLRKKRGKNYPPGPLSLPIIGNLHQLGMEPHKAFMKLSKTYGNIFSIDIGSYRAVVLNDCHSVKEAFNSDVFTGRPKLRAYLERSGGKLRGITVSEGTNWVEQRRFILKTLRDFGYGKKSMEGLIQQEIQELIEEFHTENGKPICMTHKFNAPIVNSLWHIITGERFSYDDPKFKKAMYFLTEAFDDAKYAGASLFFPTLSKIFPGLTGYNKFMNIMTAGFDIIEETMKFHKETLQNGAPRDLVDAYLQETMNIKDTKSSFYKEEGEHNLKLALSDLFLAGVETTSTILTWVFTILAQKSEEQEKLYNEIKKVVGLSRLPSLNDKQEMPYTEALTMEVLRFASIVPIGVFHNTTKDVNFQGYFIPKDTLIIGNLYAVLKDTKIWGDPNVFRPDRFILNNGELNRHHYGYMPFSIGKRVCLGEALAKDEIFLFLTTIIQKFQIFNDPSQLIPSLNDYVAGLTLTPIPHKLILEERSI